jgi:phosphatidylglycerophosphatase A
MYVLISTFFKIGTIKKAPGTWGSLAGLILGIVIISLTKNLFLLKPERLLLFELIGCVVLFWIGVICSSQYVKIYRREDPKEVVIDEVVGQLITLFLNFYVLYNVLLVPSTFEVWGICYFGSFILFRLFDILKPWPINWCDKNIKSGIGIMLDDLLASLLAAIAFAILILIFLDFAII